MLEVHYKTVGVDLAGLGHFAIFVIAEKLCRRHFFMLTLYLHSN